MKSYKNRLIDYERPVQIYRCLTRKGKIYSIRQFGKVVAHTEQFILKDVDLVVKPKAKARVIKTGTREVHAWLEGILIQSLRLISFGWKLAYLPFQHERFFSSKLGYIDKASQVYTSEGNIYFNP